MTNFSGFPSVSLSLLTQIGAHDKSWLAKHRKEYERDIAQPTKAFVVALGEMMAERISPDIVAIPKVNGSISPINNDVRFSKDKAPYKDNMLLRFWQGPVKKTAPTLFVRVSEESIGFASGIALDTESLQRWREVVSGAGGARLTAELKQLQNEQNAEVVGQELKRVPNPYASDNPSADLLRHKRLQVRWSEPTPTVVHEVAFVDWCDDRLEKLKPVQEWLVANVG